MKGCLSYSSDYSGYMFQIAIGADRFCANDCFIKVTYTGATTTADYHSIVAFSQVSDCSINVYIPAHTYALQTVTWTTVGLYLYETYNSNIKCIIDGMTIAQAGGAKGILAQTSDFNIINAIVSNVTTTTNSTGTNIHLLAGSDYNTVIGSTRGGDAANLTNSGTGSVVTGLAV